MPATKKKTVKKAAPRKAAAKKSAPRKAAAKKIVRKQNPIVKYYKMAVWLHKTPNKKQYLGMAGEVVTASQAILGTKAQMTNFFKRNKKAISQLAHRVELEQFELTFKKKSK